MRDATPLCCCEYIDHDGERNHILACCCNCHELDSCCDRLITCNKVSRKEISVVVMSCIQRIRCPWRGGAFPLTHEMLLSVILQPIIVLILTMFSYKLVIAMVSLIVCSVVFTSFHFSKHNSRSCFLYYWTVSSITYSTIILENSVVPLSEITFWENLAVILLGAVSVICFYLTKNHCNHNAVVENPNGELLGNGVANESICPVCGIKVYPRNFHCHICQTCVPKYDYHCFWLNCCIGDRNQHFFVVGLCFGISALLYGSLLILTTICRPEFNFKILLPKDCSSVTEDTEMCLCFICGVYSMQLAFLLLSQLLHHVWLVSKGFSAAEWKDQFKYSICSASPYSRGCFRNWIYFIKKLRKVRI